MFGCGPSALPALPRPIELLLSLSLPCPVLLALHHPGDSAFSVTLNKVPQCPEMRNVLMTPRGLGVDAEGKQLHTHSAVL